MKILAIIGSPRETGNTSRLVGALMQGAEAVGHQVEIINITRMGIGGCVACGACKTGKVEYCAVNDAMQELYPKLIAADCLVLASPVYMGQVTGQLKNFLDRWYAFLEADYNIKHLPGKKYVTVTVSGAPAEAFASLTAYLDHWFGTFFKMQRLGGLIAGNLLGPEDIAGQPELLAEAEALGRSLK
ncbi:MAG TPA: flavodoxin family protein [Patescibacteria group bacterium]|nr:flavodoxin family protein [Patescibacteria group bacterium]